MLRQLGHMQYKASTNRLQVQDFCCMLGVDCKLKAVTHMTAFNLQIAPNMQQKSCTCSLLVAALCSIPLPSFVCGTSCAVLSKPSMRLCFLWCLQMLLDDQVVKTQAMRASPFIKPLEAAALSWEKLLLAAQVCLAPSQHPPNISTHIYGNPQ
jgi:hypothetical protein